MNREPGHRPLPAAASGWSRRLLRHCRRHPRELLISCGASVAGMATIVTLPQIQRITVDEAVLTDNRPILPSCSSC